MQYIYIYVYFNQIIQNSLSTSSGQESIEKNKQVTASIIRKRQKKL